MQLHIGRQYTLVTEATRQELDWIDQRLTFFDTSYAARNGVAQSVYKFFEPHMNRFLSGYAASVVHGARTDGLTVSVTKDPPPWTIPTLETPEDFDVAGVGWLRPYQREPVRIVLGPRPRTVLKMTVGSGKTEVAAALIKLVRGWWVFAAPRTILEEQGAERILLRTGVPIGDLRSDGRVFVDGKPVGPETHCVIPVTYQFLAEHLAWGKYGQPTNLTLCDTLARAIGFIADEAHTIAADTFSRVAKTFTNAYYRVGLSGTPFEQGDIREATTTGLLGSVGYSVTYPELLAQGYVCPSKIRVVPVPHAAPRGATWHAVYREAIVRSETRARAVADVCARAAKPMLVFVDDIKNGHLVGTAEMCRSAGLRTAVVHGGTPDGARSFAVKGLREGEYDCIVATEVLEAGIDVPELRSVVIATGGKSAVAAIQRLGRGVRMSPGKDHFELWDFFDYVPGADKDSPRQHRWCAEHSRKRLNAYTVEGHKPTIGPIDGPFNTYTTRWRPDAS